jgi:hypothetical protein
MAHMKLQIEKLKRGKFGSERASRLLDRMAFELEELEGTATEDELAAERCGNRDPTIGTHLKCPTPPCSSFAMGMTEAAGLGRSRNGRRKSRSVSVAYTGCREGAWSKGILTYFWPGSC